MPKEPVVKLNCSFCDKNQREVRKLIAGRGVYICDECIGLCNQILGEERARDLPSDVAPESARGFIVGLIEQEARICELLDEIEARAGPAIPETVREALVRLVAASRGLLAEVQSWAGAEALGGSVGRAPIWLRPCLERLTGTVDALQALRPALEGLVPGLRLKVLDDAVGQISEVRGLLATAAANESMGKAPSVD